jgi:hypothetical protein
LPGAPHLVVCFRRRSGWIKHVGDGEAD